MKLKDFLKEELANPAVKAAYDALEGEYALARALIEARHLGGLTQAELAERMHTTQSTVARWESGKHLPSCQTLQRIARATNTDLRVAFVPRGQTAVRGRIKDLPPHAKNISGPTDRPPKPDEPERLVCFEEPGEERQPTDRLPKSDEPERMVFLEEPGEERQPTEQAPARAPSKPKPAAKRQRTPHGRAGRLRD